VLRPAFIHLSAMRIRISHATTYHYDVPASMATQVLRLTPRNHDGQYVANWQIELSEDCRLHRGEDAFGNITQTFTAKGPFSKLTVEVKGIVETQDTSGIVTGTVERFPPQLFLRETALTAPDQAIIAFAEAAREAAGTNALDVLHRLLSNLHAAMAFDPDPTHVTTTASEAFALKRGVCQDITHIFIACSRHLGIPARYIGGYFHRSDGIVMQDAGHAWAECHVDGLGWVAFDPTNGISATDAHVRVAAGLDYLGAAPVRGTRVGGSGETLDVAISVDQAHQQMQN
jgi:transglutaminase-like putative cysteine protease